MANRAHIQSSTKCSVGRPSLIARTLPHHGLSRDYLRSRSLSRYGSMLQVGGRSSLWFLRCTSGSASWRSSPTRSISPLPSMDAGARRRRRCTYSASPEAGLAPCSLNSCCATSVPRGASWLSSGSPWQPTSRCLSLGIQGCSPGCRDRGAD